MNEKRVREIYQEELIQFESPQSLYEFLQELVGENQKIPIINENPEDILDQIFCKHQCVEYIHPKKELDRITLVNFSEGIKRIAYESEFEGIPREDWGIDSFLGNIFLKRMNGMDFKNGKNPWMSIEMALYPSISPSSEERYFLDLSLEKESEKRLVYTAESGKNQTPFSNIMDCHLGPNITCGEYDNESPNPLINENSIRLYREEMN